MVKRGTKQQVWEGTAQQTTGGLTRDDLMESESSGKIISKKKHDFAINYGFGARSNPVNIMNRKRRRELLRQQKEEDS